MNPSISPIIRPAHATDAPILVNILHAAFAEYEGKLDPPSGSHLETEETLLKKLVEGGAFLAWIGEEAAGCVFYEVHEEYVYLGRLSVLPEHRNQGIAKLLIAQVEQLAKSLNRNRVQLGTRLVLTHLIDFYTRLGYRPIQYAAHKGYTQPTYAILEKEV